MSMTPADTADPDVFDAPTPATFRQLGLPQPVVDALEHLGYDAPFAIQAEVVPAALRGRDVAAQAETGSGKTLAFALPAICLALEQPGQSKRPTVLALTPTRELAAQVADVTRELGEPLGLRVRGLLRRDADPPRRETPRGRLRHPDRHAGPSHRSLRAQGGDLRPGPAGRGRRGRPHGRHGVRPPGRLAAPSPARRAPDDRVLGHPRGRCGPADRELARRPGRGRRRGAQRGTGHARPPVLVRARRGQGPRRRPHHPVLRPGRGLL